MTETELLDLDLIKKQLNEELRDLIRRSDCNLDRLHASEDPLIELVDKASNLIDRSLSQNICNRFNQRINRLEQALQKIENGVYGICECCDEDIAFERLKVNPVARLCIECKTELESKEQLAKRW